MKNNRFDFIAWRTTRLILGYAVLWLLWTLSADTIIQALEDIVGVDMHTNDARLVIAVLVSAGFAFFVYFDLGDFIGAYRRTTRLLDNDPNGVIVVTLERLIVFANPAGALILTGDVGRSPVGHHASDYFPTAEIGPIEPQIQELVLGKRQTLITTNRIDRPDECIVECTTVLASYRQRPAFLCVMRDITAREQLQRETIRLHDRLADADRVESLGILAGGIAHDFNNITAAILGNVQLALLDADETSELYTSLKQIESSARRARDLTTQLLAYAGRGELRQAVYDINYIVTQTLAMIRKSVPMHVTIETDLEEGLDIMADMVQIGQLVMNLIINASQAIPTDTQGIIRVRTRRLDSPVELHSYQPRDLAPGKYVLLQVTDNGAGIEQAALKRIFDPFFTTKPTGTGLGLAAVLGVIRAHNGAGIKVSSALGEGTTFTAALPAYENGDGAERAVGE